MASLTPEDENFIRQLASSNPSVRIAELNGLNEKIEKSEITTEQLPLVLRQLFQTHAYYIDRESRKAVRKCLLSLSQSESVGELFLKKLILVIKHESSKLGIAAANAFVLLEWLAELLPIIAKSPELFNAVSSDLIAAQSSLLDICMGNPQAKPSMRQQLLVITRRGLRGSFKLDNCEDIIKTYVTTLTTKAANPTAKNTVLLGIVAGVAARIEKAKVALAGFKKDIYTFYTREILGSKVVLPSHIAGGLGDFFENFTTADEFATEVVPPLERSLLRAPEVILNDIFSPLIRSLPKDQDLSKPLEEKLLKQLLSSLKSTNPVIRNGGLSGFQTIISHCNNPTSISKIADEIINPIKTSKVPSADQRILQVTMALSLPEDEQLAAKIPLALAAVAAKEAHEGAAGAIIACLLKFVHVGLRSGQLPDKTVLDTITKGLQEKRLPIRRLWATKLGDQLWEDNDNKTTVEFAEAVLPALSGSLKEVAANPIQAAQSGIISAAYVYTAYLTQKADTWDSASLKELAKKEDIRSLALAATPKPSFLLNFKAYTKLTSEDDLKWFLRALTSFNGGSFKDAAAAEMWAFGFFYLFSGQAVSPSVRKLTSSGLDLAYHANPKETGQTIIKGLWAWFTLIESGEKDCAPASGKVTNSLLANAIRAICPQGSAEDPELIPMLETQLVDLAVLMHHQLLAATGHPSGDLWINICQRSGVDPGDLVARNKDKLVDSIKEITESPEKGPLAKTAAFRAAPTLSFIAPADITPLFVNLFTSDLNPSLLQGVSQEDVAIWRAPADVPYVDVLSTKATVQLKKNAKDYDALKWEQELQAEIERKRGVQKKKLTPEEQAKVKAQLTKEAAIREKITNISQKFERGVGLVHALAEGPSTPVEIWLGPAVIALLKTLEAGAGLILGDRGVNAYLAMSSHVSTRLGNLRKFVGIAALRAVGIQEIEAALKQEPIESLTTRLFYRLRTLSEQRPFDADSLHYILPLLLTVFSSGGLGAGTAEELDEQIVLAIEILGYHTETCQTTSLPRKNILEALIQCMQKYTQHFKIIKDCLMDLCRCIAPNMNDEEIKALVRGVIVPEIGVRTATLQAIDAEVDLGDLDVTEEIFIAYHDEVSENAELAQNIWDENGLEVADDLAQRMVPYIQSQDRQLRTAASKALAACIREKPQAFKGILDTLEALYKEKAKPIVPLFDEFGIQKKTDMRDPWEARSGIALALLYLGPVFATDELVRIAKFLIEGEALGDRNATVRQQFIEAATAIIALQGESKLEELMAVLEKSMETPDTGSDVKDRINEAVIILYGALGRHLKAGDKRVPAVIQKLIDTLSIPSENVQYAVAECLPPLVKLAPDVAAEKIEQVLEATIHGKDYATRRGSAYGLAGLVRGEGISALKKFKIVYRLKAAADDKKDSKARQGALFGFELLSLILGRLFEPYVLQIVPLLLSMFGDASIDVREACSDTVRVCFSTLSAYGVKIVLPNLLDGLDDVQWRSKKGACEMLGAMAYLAPHQLAISLPEIIPPLTNVLNDSHKEVRAAANRSLQKFGDVIQNPEIKSLVGVLLKALSDPTKYTDTALDSLIKVSFAHYLDAPSLALVVRILERALSERSAAKRKASQIIGSLAHLTERKDIMVHIPILVAGLKSAIVDPVPGTRATASKSLGTLVEKLGEDALPDIIPGLMAVLKSDTGAGDRLGSAQALSEVLSGLGTQRLEEILPTILQNSSSAKPAVREGFMSLFIYLPACFGNSFSAYLSRIIPPILAGLADDVESIRDVSLRAGRLLVKNFATRAIDLLLPELERGLADVNYRIRLSSVELVGDLLFNLTGISGKPEEEEDIEKTKEVSNALLEILGREKRDKVLSALYICRCDTSGQVRLAAVAVWKALVSSPKTLKELVPTLTQLIIRRLASSNSEQRTIAGQALGEVIRKAGEGVLSTLLPTLEEGLRNATDVDSRQGICIALKEVIQSTSDEVIEENEEKLVHIIRSALVDPDDETREAAAEAFDALQQIIGRKTVSQILPYLLNMLRSESDADNALAALLTLLTEETRAGIILPNLIPTLLQSPITGFNARALASLAGVAGSSLNRRLPAIINALMDNIVACKDEELAEELNTSFDQVLLSVDEYDGLNTSMNVMLALLKHDDHKKRAVACRHMANYFAEAEVDYSRYTQNFIRSLLELFDDRDMDVVKAAWNALNELTKKLRKEEMENLVGSTRSVLQTVGVAGSNLPGFALPKGISAILPIFSQGLMNGTSEQRIQSALAISDIIDRASPESLRPYVTNITGPLIRVVSERSVEVKAAILLTLNNLLSKIPSYLKPFLPQLQRTFAKSLADTSSDVLRTRAAKALGTLITLTPRIDPLITELVTGAKTHDAGVKGAMIKALYEVISKAGQNMGDASKQSILALVDSIVDDSDDNMDVQGAKLLGALLKFLSADDANRVIRTNILGSTSHMAVLSLNAALLESPEALLESTFSEDVPAHIAEGLQNKDPFVSDNCVLASGKYLLSEPHPKPFEATKAIFEGLATAVKAPASGSTDTKRLALMVIRTIARLHYDQVAAHIPLLAPVVFGCVRDMVIPVKLSAEQAFLAIFQVVEDESKHFDKYINAYVKDATLKRSMGDYFKRVALRLAAAERERIDAGGASAGLDEGEDDLKEINSVGRADNSAMF
ncbi:ARM repeat-containing protein [Ascobolus immersus RN42]|uniref:eIF-2-alpha kinase activator GCN1 n=1 Tax=Ascobolus immersus RN42 TaxID=1160509 RepID=A0A3N4I2L2_ASCIM|nr:ARM repeat-containing protein [Ascobolus immersus RN42]